MFKNFLNTLRRYKMASALNLIGLSVALAAFLIIIIQVKYELSFDRFHSKADRIYKVELTLGTPDNGVAVVSRALINTFGESSPQIESYTLIGPAFGESYFTIQRDGSKVGFREDIEKVYPSISDIFDFEMVEGDIAALQEPNKVIIPQSKAKLYFPDESALGKIMQFDSTKFIEVGGVYKDFPINSQINNSIYQKISDYEGRDGNGNDLWSMNNFWMYVVLTPDADPTQIAQQYEQSINLSEKMFSPDQEPKLLLTPISDLYFAQRNFVVDHMIEHGDRTTTDMLIAIALLILLIAAINFVNFSTSLAPIRMKSINIQKILGSLNAKLRWVLIIEAVGLCLISFAISILIVALLEKSSFNDITMSGISLKNNQAVVALTAVMALLLGLLAGIYPAFYTTKFPPMLALKGSFAMSPKGRMLRITLIGFQFVVSIALIVGAIFLQVQNNYMRRMDTGMQKDNIAIITLGGALRANTSFDNELRKSPLITDVSYSQFNIGGSNSAQGWGRSLRDQKIEFDAHLVSWSFPQMMGLKMAEGNYFTESDTKKEELVYIFNQTAAKLYGITNGDKIGESEVVGIVQDFNTKSLHYPIVPIALVLPGNGANQLATMYIKIEGNPYQAVDYIRAAATKIDPAYPLDIQFYDQTFNNLYQKEQKSARLITLFSILAITISLVGVFGLVVFETQYRRKEIGLRRVNGATVGSILLMFNRRFVWIVVTCFVIATPIAWYGVAQWLTTFEYRTPLHWWVFGVALVVVLSITVFTVSAQSWRAANENPVKSLKAE